MTIFHAGAALALLGRTILVVEDDPILGMDIVDQLEAVGAEVAGPLSTITEAMAAIEGDLVFHAALLDAHLKDGPADRVIDALTGRRTPFILVTGDDNFGLVYSPDAPCVPKPVDMPKVMRMLATMLP